MFYDTVFSIEPVFLTVKWHFSDGSHWKGLQKLLYDLGIRWLCPGSQIDFINKSLRKFPSIVLVQFLITVTRLL